MAHSVVGAGHFGAAVWVPPFRRWDISAPAVSAPDTYATATAPAQFNWYNCYQPRAKEVDYQCTGDMKTCLTVLFLYC